MRLAVVPLWLAAAAARSAADDLWARFDDLLGRDLAEPQILEIPAERGPARTHWARYWVDDDGVASIWRVRATRRRRKQQRLHAGWTTLAGACDAVAAARPRPRAVARPGSSRSASRSC